MSIYDKASLVLIPSGTKTSKVYSQKPTNGDGDFTFSRSTAATRVNADGNIEKETQNLLLQSNSFNSWFSNNTSETSGQSGYDGTNDAWLLGKSAASAYMFVNNTVSGVQTFSVYAKAGSLDWMRIVILGASDFADSFFNLADGSVGVNSGLISASSESIGGGWYRYSLLLNGSPSQVRIYPADFNGNVSGTSGNILIQDAQREQGLVARDYIETTTTAIYGGITDNVPRLDYTDSSCPALLLEPQRTNSATHSEYFGAWSAFRATITDNSATSPEGVSNAAVLTEDTTNNSHPLNKTFSVSSGAEYTLTIFAKQGSRRYLALLALNGGSTIYYDLQEKTAGSGGSVEDYGNGWLRLIYTYTTNSTSAELYIQPSINGSSVVYTGDGSNAVYLYGAQLEAGSYATSYIPTYGSAVTRNSDTTYKYNATSIVGDTEGVMFIDCVPPANDNPILMQLINNTSVYSQSIYFEYVKSINKIRCNAYDSGILQASFQLDAVIGNQYKIALAYKENDFAFYVNGSLIGTDTNASVQSGLQDILIGVLKGSFGSYNFIGNYVNQAMLFKTRLSNEELAALTTI